LQRGSAQCWLSQPPLQQSASFSQAAPLERQAFVHVPFRQARPEQQTASLVHSAPDEEQTQVQRQTPEQHSPGWLQVWSVTLHV
jgi:hypothetical protein